MRDYQTMKMASKNNMFTIGTYNCKHFNDYKIDFMKTLVGQCNMIFLQEHCMYSESLDNLYKLGDVCYHGTSSMDINKPLIGRPHGGCAIVWKSDFNCKVSPIATTSDRVWAVMLKLPSGVSIIAINTYFPCDYHVKNTSFELLMQTLDELTVLLNEAVCDAVLIGGDLNTDFQRSTFHVNAVKDFIHMHSLKCAVDHILSNITYTFESAGTGAKSCIDHIIVSENLNGLITNYDVVESVENNSDHLPVLCGINLLIENIIRTDRNFVGRAAWSKASLGDISQYKCKLDDFLKTVHVPLEAVQCKDPKCDRHSENIDKFHKDIVGGCLQAAELSIPKTKKPNKHRIPGWNQFVKEKHWSALFWHERWKENGRPTEGEIAAVMRYTRHQYHYAVRHCKKNEVKIKATRMAEAMTNNHTRDFWAEVNKLNCSQRGVPETVDGVNDPNGIADLFFDKFKHLYSSVAYDNDKMDDFKRSLDTDIEWDYQKLVSDGSIVNVNDILKLTRKLKSGKSDGNRGLSSDCIIHGTKRLFILLAMFYNSVLTHGQAPEDILLGTMTPIPKCNGLTNSSDKYRANNGQRRDRNAG